MYFEVYLDSLFWINLVMNFYLLYLTNRLKEKTASNLRILLGACFGALISCVVFFIPFSTMGVKIIIGCLLSGIGMVVIAFRVKTFKGILRKMASMTVMAFFVGGTFLFLFKRFFFLRKYQNQTFILLFLGGLVCMAGSYCLERWKSGKKPICFVTLENREKTKRIEALIDTGNSLIEPISGKPVSILNKELMKEIFDGEIPEFYRVVPFSCVGIEKGLLKCFEIPKMNVEYEDTVITYEHIFVAYSEEYGREGRYQMILNPCLLQ